MYKAIRSYFSLIYVEDVFIDVVSGKQVKVYRDCYGEYWLKDSRWSLFQVKTKNGWVGE